MTDNKFKSKQELDEYIKNNSTSFEEFEKKLDYSLFEKRSKKNKKHKGFSLKKLGYAIVSFVMVVALSFGIYELIRYNKLNSKCPYELGTYIYYSQEGNIDGLDFSEKSYIVLTDQELSGPGTFVLQNKDWVVYGQFYECEFSNESKFLKNEKGEYYIGELSFTIKHNDSGDGNFIVVRIQKNNDKIFVSYKINY